MIEHRTIGIRFDAELEMHSKCKYCRDTTGDEVRIMTVQDIESWDIVTGEDAARIEEDGDASCIDDFHEYLVLHFAGGATSTYRNSYVDMHRTRYSYMRNM